MTTPLDNNPYFAALLGASDSPNTKTGYALDTAFTYQSAGKALGVRFVAPATTTLTDVWFFVSATAGTPGVVTVKLCDYGASTVLPGTQVTNGLVTVSPGTTANKWIKATFATPPAVTAGLVYWLILADAGWTTGNTTTVVSKAGGASPSAAGFAIEMFRALTSSDGFATNGANVGNPACLVLKFGDGSYLGNPITAGTATWTSNTRERGMKISGLTEKLTVCGVLFPAATTYAALKVYEGTTVPGGSIFSGFNGGAAFTLGTGAKAVGYSTFPPCTLAKNIIYRFVFSFGSATTVPNYHDIEDAATYTADLKAAMPWGGAVSACIDNGSSVWVDYDNATDGLRIVRMGLLVRDQVAIVGSGGGVPMIGGGLVRS